MLRIMAVTREGDLCELSSPDELSGAGFSWFWADFNAPTEEEALLLETYFHFHPLAIEDCFHLLQRPKLDHYEDVHFFVLHALNHPNLDADEVDMFIGKNYLVTFHHNKLPEVDDAWSKLAEHGNLRAKGHLYAMYLVVDKLVDNYFPAVYEIEDQLLEVETGDNSTKSVEALMNNVFKIRSRLLKLRKTIVPMRDLLYRILNTERIEGLKEQRVYFTDIYDHLLKLSEMIESNRDMTADMRDSYISLSSNRMNTIMKTLTVITTIFMPLTFIAGIYGMNFQNMPELSWRWGYFVVLGAMFLIGFGMFAWFRKKGWFE
ncbi:magnesium/cobalt transporter CorA [Paenibacillus hamazuiensis]|uniref:magnesium/cobalt transporter CorA n=1 Tax=Paenibacillus hamazuiensis TaxID=2936508 RepID=UPI00200F17D0|nr:magnesium/cobalt transporter CorA [Paenibacillus hamazuiensis]